MALTTTMVLTIIMGLYPKVNNGGVEGIPNNGVNGTLNNGVPNNGVNGTVNNGVVEERVIDEKIINDKNRTNY